jgi:ubiquinol-cytochrome c reductase cytochrome c1 subunit
MNNNLSLFGTSVGLSVKRSPQPKGSARSLRVVLLSLLVVVASIFVQAVQAAPSNHPIDPVPSAKLSDKAAMQDGAKTFMNYCLGCHGVSAMRYSRLSDIGMSEEDIKKIMPPGAKTGETIRAAMSRQDAKEWFGAAPPDLSLTARARSSHSASGADWVYTFLRSYQPDTMRPTGWNNKLYPGVGMPHVLWEMQKSLPAAEYDQKVGNLAAFLNYVAEPVKSTRKTIGIFVMIFLIGFFFIAWRLNKAYWKNIK